MGFNTEQARAIEAGIDEDILITAGAGSGKTKTLSERVYRIISDPNIGLKPSELLVLTFTNNAAYEMKTRIIARFASEGEEKAELASEMVSAHVQTFDSFNQYLVSSYSDALGLPSSIAVANPTVLAVKAKETLDVVLTSFYQNESVREDLARLIRRFSWKTDDALRKEILNAYDRLRKLTPAKQKDLLEHYEERFLSDAFIERAYEDYVTSIKSELISILWKAAYVEKTKRGGELECLENQAFWQKDVDQFAFEDSEYAEPAYEGILSLIQTPDIASFVEAANQFSMKYGRLFPRVTSRKGTEKEEKDILDAPWKVMKNAYGRKDSVINRFLTFPSLEETKAKKEKDRPIYVLFLSILKEFAKKMDEVRREMNAYDFSDISAMALELLTLPKYADIAEEIRCRFRYIMVDEYQDTNDAQEVFLESLLKVNHFGRRAHLFCVGDAKQSIYAFRNSNVALFRARQEAYLKGPGHEVIPMNKNYRSGPGLLSDFNYIFTYYMTLQHGGIDYSSPLERLEYDQKVNLYSEPYSHFGVERIAPNAPLSPLFKQSEYEARAIAADIKEKVESGYLVYDRSSNPHVRPCRYSDFVILMKKKKSFGAYQKFFNQLGIRLNNVMTEDLKEVGAILLLQSLLGLVSYFLGEKELDAPHLFASFLRSYVLSKTDEEIAKIFARKGNTPEERFQGVEEWERVKAFSETHEASSFKTLFMDLLIEFGLLERLHVVGEVEDLSAKIESMYLTACSIDAVGESVHGFYEMLRSISKNKLDLKSEMNIQSEDAVTLMSIHASKGLEQKIVYMPCSCSGIRNGSSEKPTTLFLEKYGFQMNEGFDLAKHIIQEDSTPSPVYGIAGQMILNETSKQAEIDEHVRLFYVALTRAENALIIVGDPFYKLAGSPYEMLESCPNVSLLDVDYLKQKVEQNVLSDEDLQAYLDSLKDYPSVSVNVSKEVVSKEAYAVYLDVLKDFQNQKRADNDLAVKTILIKLLEGFSSSLGALPSDLDLASRVVFELDHPGEEASPSWNLSSFYQWSLASACFKKNEEEDEEDEEVDDSGEDANPFGDIKGPDAFHRPLELESLEAFQESLLGAIEDLKTLEKKKNSDEVQAKAYARAYYCLPTFVKYFDHQVFSLKRSFKTDGFEDRVKYFDFEPMDRGQKQTFVIPTYQVNDDPIVFEPRIQERASKRIEEEDAVDSSVLDYGTHLHRLMELVDWKKKDASFILDPRERSLIEKILVLPIFKGQEFYPEYAFFDPMMDSSGSIDLLIKDGEKYTIVDFKASSIDDPDYDRQLRTYGRNVQRIFHAKKENIRLVLLSIMHAKTRVVPFDEFKA